jgi:hypothetical protein
MNEAIKVVRGGGLGDGNYGKHRDPVAVVRLAPTSAEDAIAGLP